MSEGFRLRVKYRITGRLAFLSHLETIRSVERIVRRAQLPFAITEGFNPHMKIAFGPALPVGAGSNGEYFDVRLRDYVASGEALAALQAAAPENLMPITCTYCEHGADAIDVHYPVSSWRAVLDLQDVSFDEVRHAFSRLLEQGFIEVVKVKGGKTKVKRIDFEGRLVESPQFTDENGQMAMEFATRQGNEGALRPDKFIAAACELLDPAPALRDLTRLELRES